jgi:uncharacterized protein (DUF697 family)
MATKDTKDVNDKGKKAESSAEESSWDKNQVANSIVKRHSALAAGAGAVPVPVGDVVASIGIQLNMINRLCRTYGVEFTQSTGRNAALSLLGTMIPQALKAGAISLIKVIPFIGSYAGAAAMPALNAATTLALGKVFIKHFESGGTLLNFDAPKVQEYFKQQVEAASSGPTAAAA